MQEEEEEEEIRRWKKTAQGKLESRFFPSPFHSRQTWIFSIRGAASRIGGSFRFEINISRRWKWGGKRKKRRDQGEESCSNRDEARSPLGTLIFIVAEVCARFLQSHTLSTRSPSFTIPATSLETTIFPRFRVPPKLSFHGMKRRFFFALCTSPSLLLHFLSKLPTKWRVETSLSSRPCLPPSVLQNLFTSSFGLLAPFTSTAKQVPSPILSPFERLVPPIKPRELLFSRPVSTAHCSLAQVSLRFKHFFFTLYPAPPRFFIYQSSQTFPSNTRSTNCTKGYCFLERISNHFFFSFLFSPRIFQDFLQDFSIFEGRFIPVSRVCRV